SDWDCTLEPTSVRPEPVEGLSCSIVEKKGQSLDKLGTNGVCLRLGLRQIDGLQHDAADRLIARRPYRTVEELRGRSGVAVHAIQRLAAADAFRSMGLDRRAALWDSRALRQSPDLPLFAYAEARDEGSESEPAQLPAMPLGEHVVNDYQTIRLSLKAHPMAFLREHYAGQKFATADQLKHI